MVRISSFKTRAVNGHSVTTRYEPLLLKLVSLRKRAGMLRKLRAMLALKPGQDISGQQWEVLESQLTSVSARIVNNVRICADRYVANRADIENKRFVANRLGELEVELTNAYGFYDTYMDILTQRLSDDIGPKLRGCDVIAEYALRQGGIGEVTVSPLVYCERGFGASTLREGVDVTQGTANPIPFIAIPYSRIAEKYNLISIFHEVGHQAVMKLDMLTVWQQVFFEAARNEGASTAICNLYARWSREAVPDFWAFCLAGMAQTCSIRDVLMLPYSMMFSVSMMQPHPPSFLRFLFSVACCRQCWGRGEWDEWEREWTELYPLNRLSTNTRELMTAARKVIPAIARALLLTRFRRLQHRTLTSVFDMAAVSPDAIRQFYSLDDTRSPAFQNSSIGTQLAAFRMMRENAHIQQEKIDRRMDEWLRQLGDWKSINRI